MYDGGGEIQNGIRVEDLSVGWWLGPAGPAPNVCHHYNLYIIRLTPPPLVR